MISEIGTAIQKIQNSTQSNINSVAHAMEQQDRERNMFGILYNIFLAISRNLLELQRTVDRIAGRIMVAELGKLTPSILSTKDLPQIVEAATPKLAADMALLMHGTGMCCRYTTQRKPE